VLLKPNIQEALRETGLAPKKRDGKDKRTAEQVLDEQGANSDSIYGVLAQIMEGGGSEHTKLRAVELALRARGDLKAAEAPTVLPSITIVINDPKSTAVSNPILFPRRQFSERSLTSE
jgi:hypothetical protein